MTVRDDKIVEFIRAFRDERGYMPTMQEIGAGVGLSSRSAVHRHLVAMRAAGVVDWEANQTRTLRLVDES